VTELDDHKRYCEAKFAEFDARLDKLLQSQERLTNAIEKLTNDTQGVVDLYQNAQGAITIGVALQKLGIWVIKWPVVGAGMYSIYHWVQGRI